MLLNKLKKILLFDGRINKKEFVISFIICFFSIFWIRDNIISKYSDYYKLIFLYLYYSQSVKRLHDRGLNGIYAINPLSFIGNLADKSNDEINKYGNVPDKIFTI